EAAGMLGGASGFKKLSVKGKYRSFDGLGVGNEVLAIWRNAEGCLFRVRADYGPDFYKTPWLEAYVALRDDGTLAGVRLGAYADHTPAFADMLTPEYLDAAYAGKPASKTFEADAATGATFTSQAVLYAVQAAANYAAGALRIGDADAPDPQMKQLMAQVPGTYEKMAVDTAFASAHGTALYAARGQAQDGAPFVALVVRSSFVPEDPFNNMAMPTSQIWINPDTGRVLRAAMVSGRFYDGFAMPPQRLEAYYGVDITDASVFDGFEAGLVTDAPEFVVSTATASFPDTLTGATPGGNDTSRAVRACFITAAQYYWGHLK
ncbi:MAG TPA: FMN-binding protein, partial [Candidatus Limnocylindria bacterium]|nr:FMN-binding protein [Candidatus Limnocylindria bacterium]